jgi:hypothetical protein
MEHNMIIHMVHVSEKQKIAQQRDGLSRADHSEGVMQGKPIMDFMPLNQKPLEREPKLKPWLDSVMKGLGAEFLSPEGLFDKGHGYGTYVWTPTSAKAEVVVEQLGRAKFEETRQHAYCCGIMGDDWMMAMSHDLRDRLVL